MLDKLTEKLLENAMSVYTPKLEEISKIRAEELAAVRAQVRTNPEVVEAWFDKEIASASKIDVNDIMKKIGF
jgi:hypothetical protein